MSDYETSRAELKDTFNKVILRFFWRNINVLHGKLDNNPGIKNFSDIEKLTDKIWEMLHSSDTSDQSVIEEMSRLFYEAVRLLAEDGVPVDVELDRNVASFAQRKRLKEKMGW